MQYDFDAFTGELNRLTSEGPQKLGFIVCPYSGGDRGEVTVFKFLFKPTAQISLTDGDLQAILTFGSERENEARAAYLAECAAQEATKSVQNLDNGSRTEAAQETKPQATDLDSAAERILATFKSEDETLTDADLLAASGLTREKYLDVRDFVLIETEEISELADTVPTEYIRNWPHKTEAAA